MNLEHRLLKTGGVVGGRPPARGACGVRVLLGFLVRWGAFSGGKFDAVGLELLTGSGQVV